MHGRKGSKMVHSKHYYCLLESKEKTGNLQLKQSLSAMSNTLENHQVPKKLLW